MPAWTLQFAQTRLSLWLDAEAALATGGQSYTLDVGGSKRSLTRADLSEVREQINYWRREVTRLESGSGSGPRVRLVVPRV